MNTQELEIEAPWGKIATKLWGNEGDPAVLAVHGVMDNAGSFDEIIPLLPKYFYICIDLPGHGKSSQFPPHTPLYTLNNLMVYTLVMDYFKRDKYIIIGHSYGGQIGLLFTRLYPERVKKLIMLDTVNMLTIPTEYFGDFLVSRFHALSELEKKMKTKATPQYTYQEALDKLIQARPSPLTEKSAKALLQRTLIPIGNDKFELAMDQRLKFFINPIHDTKYAIETLKECPVKCPVLIVFGLDNPGQRHIQRSIINHLKKQKNVTIKYIPGHHDIHLTDPEKVAPIILDFLNFQQSKL